jgi:hypothetical protein
MNNLGWIVNDRLSCFDTKTFWHDLLDWLPGLENKATGIDFSILPNKIEKDFNNSQIKPKYIIRNATFFRRLNINTKTISLFQDLYLNDSGIYNQQKNVCENSDVTVFNSIFTYELSKSFMNVNYKIIPLGVDFDFFTPVSNEQKNDLKSKYGLNQNPYIIFIGKALNYPKGFDLLQEIVNNTNYNFIFAMNDDYVSNHPRVKVFNKINHNQLRELINCCELCLCTSKTETQHLSGIECAACNLPLVTTNVGIYYNEYENSFGHIASNAKDFINAINTILSDKSKYSSREFFIKKRCDKKSCRQSWCDLIENLIKIN